MFKKKKSDVVVVTTKEQLKTAVKQKAPQIEVQGELAKKLKWMGKISVPKVMALTGVLGGMAAAAPAAPVAAFAAPSIAAITGQDIALIIVASGLAVGIVVAVLRDYHVKVEANGNTLLLTRK